VLAVLRERDRVLAVTVPQFIILVCAVVAVIFLAVMWFML
jgi:hypothetical protein